jgi:hypothetical protein
MASLSSLLIRGPVSSAAERYLDWRFRRGELRFVFICGHMRSGSSLLLHVLNTSPEVIGYGELLRGYRTRGDFAGAALQVYRSFGRVVPRERYVLDKVLHDRFLPDPGLLDCAEARTIFLLRSPEESLPSIAKLPRFERHGPGKVLTYYLGRLRWMSQAVRRIDPTRWVHLTYTDLVDQPETEFRQIERLLALNTPLTTRYSLIWSTGEARIGDPSKRIREGVIVRPPAKEVPIPLRPLLDEATAAYTKCCELFEQMKAGQRGYADKA